VIPVLIYPDVREAVEWLGTAFGFVERVRIGERHRSQLSVRDGAVIVGDVRNERRAPGRRVVSRGMSAHVVIARVFGLAGRADELRRLLGDRALATRAEAGCAGYEVAALVDEPAGFLVVETWESGEAMRAHFASEAHANYQHQVDELLARPSEAVVHEVAATTRPAPSTSPADPGRFG
jgi:quinol monooxygenase YgiN